MKVLVIALILTTAAGSIFNSMKSEASRLASHAAMEIGAHFNAVRGR